MTATAGQVHKVIRIVGTSPDSWEGAAASAVAEAGKTISDLREATVVEADALVGDGGLATYRVKLEVAFQLDRSRPASTDAGAVSATERVDVRRYLILANQTLASPGLQELVSERASVGPAEFHVLVPESPPSAVYADPTSGPFDHHLVTAAAEDRLVALAEAEERLDAFRMAFAHLGPKLTGEVGLGDPVTATRRVMERSSFDEIIVSTLPPGLSRWLKMDLATRLERAFKLPVVALVQEPAERS
ncbi:MAG: dodecin domain-containing protein [Actinomycetota bacterium]